MTDRQQCHALISRFETKVKAKGLAKPTINRNTERWAADDLLKSMSKDDLHRAMDYYVSIADNPTWVHFVRNADKLFVAAVDYEKDIKERNERREKLRAILNER